MIRVAILIAALVATWLVWSGLLKGLLLFLGVLSVGLTVWISLRMRLTAQGTFLLDLAPRLLAFWGWLFKEIVRSNFRVARIILDPRLPISPTLVTLDSPAAGPIGQATIANCMTLTPGTLTVDAHEGRYTVHCLTRAGADEVLEDEIGRRVADALGDQ